MTPTQKRFVEIPLLLGLLWLIQALEISFLQMPFQAGAVHVVPVVIVYFALTRSWTRLVILSILFALAGSFTVGHAATIYVAVQFWTALFSKVIVSEFALEGRKPFAFLVVGSNAFSKTLTWILLGMQAHAMPAQFFLKSLFLSMGTTAIVAWFIFPLCVSWDEYFDHPVHESRELNPDILR